MTDEPGSVVVATRPTPGRPAPVPLPAVRAGDARQRPDGAHRPPARPSAHQRPARLSQRRRGRAGRRRRGATVLSARALTEGTERYDAIALIEATERLGASLHADASWDAYTVGDRGARDRGSSRRSSFSRRSSPIPTFPEAEVERIRDERLNDMLQARADARRRVDEAFAATIYRDTSPYHRPSGGTTATVAPLDRSALARAWSRGLDPSPDDARRRRRPGRDRPGAPRRGASWPAGPGPRAPSSRARSRPARPRVAGACGWSTSRARLRPRSGSATSGSRGGSRISMRCRSWAPSSADCSTRVST